MSQSDGRERVHIVQPERNAEADVYKSVPLDLSKDPIFSKICPSVSACYHDSSLELPENAQNPLILALPPFEARDRLAKAMALSFAIPHSKDARNLPLQLRLLGIERISRVLVLTEAHLKLLDWIHISLRHRYRGLVPTRSLRKLAQENYESTQRGHTKAIYAAEESHADCISVLGISGAGKTTTVKMVLRMFPMIIEHTVFREIEARFAQVVWIFVSCPPNGSVLTLMKGILHWFDAHLNTKYVEEVKSRANTGDFIQAVVDKLRLHHVGLLVIDEIQFAIQSAEKVDLMGFLTSLLNDGECLFVLVGTPDAGELIKQTVRNLRRVVSRTFIPLDLFPLAEDAKRLARSIIAVDFLPEEPDAPEAAIKTLIEVSAGSPAFMKLAWEHSQYAGLRAKVKSVTPALIRSAVTEAFSLVEGLLAALRKKDLLALDRYRDTAIAQLTEIRERMALDKERHRLKLNGSIDEASEKFSKCVGALVNMGWPETNAEAFSRACLLNDVSVSVESVIRMALASDEPPTEVTRRSSQPDRPTTQVRRRRNRKVA
ncbi:ATP-binding protein [Burkholderia cepacia]|uniref:ATP-binding protein n=1 Tax=Burkholderia cepacia TaxID=292 RepID=UPI001CF30767|nr:ATP-binding protein [Burkholderia cepacia]MCA8348512.1 ATP-binding protein [Burkholderia cepacia]